MTPLAARHLIPPMPSLLGAVQSDTLGRSLLIALLVVSPYGIYKIRQVRRVRQGHEAVLAAEAAPPKPDGPPRHALEDVSGDISFVVSEARSAGGAMLLVPHDVTVSDRDASDAVVDMLVRDALRRSGLVVTAEVDTAEGRLLECALLGGTIPGSPSS
ncbi:hypothetical protein BH10ACT3_BH10ACT3_11680 [soil metagenome]